MKFEINKEFSYFGKSEEDSRKLCQKCIDAGIFHDEEVYYGGEIRNFWDDVPVSTVGRLLCEWFGKDSIDCDCVERFGKLRIMGDGGCPYCGGELEYIGDNGRMVFSDDNLTEPWRVASEVYYKCDVCHEKITKEGFDD